MSSVVVTKLWFSQSFCFFLIWRCFLHHSLKTKQKQKNKIEEKKKKVS